MQRLRGADDIEDPVGPEVLDAMLDRREIRCAVTISTCLLYTSDLGDDVGAPDGGRMGDRGAGCGIRGIIETCRGTCPRFDSDLIPEFEKLFDGLGGGSDPGLTRPRLPRDCLLYTSRCV